MAVVKAQSAIASGLHGTTRMQHQLVCTSMSGWVAVKNPARYFDVGYNPRSKSAEFPEVLVSLASTAVNNTYIEHNSDSSKQWTLPETHPRCE